MRKLSTKNKIKFLEHFVEKWHASFYKKHPDNIVGFKISKKIKNGKTTRFYGITFQVLKKIEGTVLNSAELIPKQFEIKFPDGKIRKISTDVEETGGFEFLGGLTGEVTSNYSASYGSTGLYVNSNNKYYMITNYHVVAERFIENNQLYYKRSANQAYDVRIKTPSKPILGRFETGLLDTGRDVAFVEIFEQDITHLNALPNGIKIQGRYSKRPYSTDLIGKTVTIYSCNTPQGREGIIDNNSAIIYGKDGIVFTNLVQIKPVIAISGDSGSPVLINTNVILGLLVGSDNNYSYAIPLYKINDFKNFTLI